MNLSIKQVQDIIQTNFPETFSQKLGRNAGMFYQEAKPIVIKGKFPVSNTKRLKRTVGYSGDNLFGLEMVGKPEALDYIEFSGWADTTCLARNLVPMIAVIKAVYPDWQGENELAETMERIKAVPLEKELRSETVKLGNISVSKAVLVNAVEVVFVKVK